MAQAQVSANSGPPVPKGDLGIHELDNLEDTASSRSFFGQITKTEILILYYRMKAEEHRLLVLDMEQIVSATGDFFEVVHSLLRLTNLDRTKGYDITYKDSKKSTPKKIRAHIFCRADDCEYI